MRRRCAVISVLMTGLMVFAGCLGGSSGGTGPSGYTTELEGTWVYTESDTDYTFTLTWAFVDSSWNLTQQLVTDQTYSWEGYFELNTSAIPKEIDLYCTSSSDTSVVGMTALGIYALNSTATACTIAVNDFGDTVRPSDLYDALVMNKQ
jgi:uncharacterized protein (TIGR03067 family)